MFGEHHQQPPGQPVLAPLNPNPFAGNHASDPMLAYAAAAYAQHMQRFAPQQHAMPMYVPAPMPPPHHAMSMSVPASSMAYAPPSLPRKQGAAATSRRAQASDTGSSLWTIVVSLLVGIVIGVACARQSSPPQEQPSPQQQLRQ